MRDSARPFVALCLGLLSGAGLAMPGAAATSFDGSWSVSIVARSGECRAPATVPIRVTEGRVSYAGAFRARANGAVDESGRLAIRFSHKDRIVAASGSLEGGRGSGRWTSPTEECSGTWTARRA